MNTNSRPGMHPRLLPKTRARPLALAIALLFASPVLLAQPTGGQVVSGQASIGVPTNGLMTINQTSQKAILNWQSFSIGVGEATHFQQPAGGVALNRVAIGNPSQILGTLTSTGQLFLVNPSGILFGKGSVLNTGGLVASTLDITDSDFLGGNYRFFNNGGAAAINNQGELSAYDGAYIALLAPEVRNEGLISARLGSVAIGAGDRVNLDLDGDNLIGLSVEQSALNGRIENKHAIHADGGQVILSARAAGSLVETVINNEGAIRASSVAERNGRIVLEGAGFISLSGSLTANGSDQVDGGTIQLAADNMVLSGDIDVSGRQGGAIEIAAQGNLIQTAASQLTAIGSDGVGGRIQLQASNADAGAQVFLSGGLDARGLMGGQVHVLGDMVTLAAADVRATGASQGGEILIGGGFQGAATGVAHSRRTGVNASSVLDASTTDMGDGGRVVVWSDGVTAFAGQALAQGGALGGDGGLIEVSGKASVYFDGLVNAGPASGNGANGVFLLDPKNITISALAQGNAGYFDLADPTPAAGDQHGSTTLNFGIDQLLVLSPYDDNAATDAGAIYVYNTASGALLSMLTGDQANDRVGSGGITTLYNSGGYDYLISSPYWHASAGAVTWLDGAGIGITGVVSASNSLVGGSPGDAIGSHGIEDIYAGYSNGMDQYNYLVISPDWNGGMGAVTFGSGATGVSGVVSAANSFVGDTSGDRVGSGYLEWLYDYNASAYFYAINSPQWHGSAGALTWVDAGGVGFGGVVSAANSLVGANPNDGVGSGGFEYLSSNNYLVLSPNWDGGKGAVTFFDSANGWLTGVVSDQNSLVGSVGTDNIGSGGIEDIYDYSSNTYNYLVLSPNWNDSRGAVTFGDSMTGVSGVVSSGNSLVGDSVGDRVGSGGVQQLYAAGQYVYLIKSPLWHASAGAVTWWDGDGENFGGVVSSSNSLVGLAANDQIGSGGYVSLYSGNYLVRSPNWGGGKGAVTFLNVASGSSGVVDADNSLVGANTADSIGSGGIHDVYDSEINAWNYLVLSPNWHGELGTQGAVTFGDGMTGVSGVVSSGNSLVGDMMGDRVGSGGIQQIYADGTYAYLIKSPFWHASAGALTWIDGGGSAFQFGDNSSTVSAANSLVGSVAGDGVGSGGISTLSGGIHLARSPNWGGGKGAVTFINPSNGVVGEVGAANSLVGANSTDNVGSGGVQSIYDSGSTYNYLVLSPNWNGTFGAVTFGNGATGVSGLITASNSFIGDQSGDRIGSSGITTLSNSGGYDYLIRSPLWHGSTGAVTWFDGSGVGFGGVVGAGNSLVGSTPGDNVGSNSITTIFNSGIYDYVVVSSNWNGNRGAVTFGDGDSGVFGAIGNQNSLVGTTAGDFVGSSGLTSLSSGHYVVRSPSWGGGAGAVTFYNRNGGVVGEVGAANSLVGANSTDNVGSGGVQSIYDSGSTYNYLVLSPNWNGTFGAVTFGNGATGVSGLITASNSFIGDQSGDRIGSSGITTLSNSGGYDYLIRSPLWHASTGAVTWFDGSGVGFGGVVGAGNSLVGSTAGDNVGSSSITTINNSGIYDYVVVSSSWNGNRGAVTFGDGDTGVFGAISSQNSLVGTTAGDFVGSSGLTSLSSGHYVVRSPSWGGGAGAVTFYNRNGGVVGAVGAENSLVGANSTDNVGSGGVQSIYDSGSTYNYLVLSPNWNGTLGAVTFGNGATGVSGLVSASNSFIGDQSGDRIGSSGITTLFNSGGYDYLIRSPLWHASTGAVTWFDGSGIGFGGVVSVGNSLLGGNPGDQVGSSLYTIYNYNNGAYFYDYLVNSPNWNGGFGALTLGSGTTGVSGFVSAGNSIVGTQSGDLSDWTYQTLSTGRYLFDLPDWGDTAGRLLVWSSVAGGGGGSSSWSYGDDPGADVTISSAQIASIASTGTNVLLQAHNDITLASNSNIVISRPNGYGGDLRLEAGRSILLNSNIISDGNIYLTANDTAANGVQAAYRDGGVAVISMAAGKVIESEREAGLYMREGLSAGTAGGITLATLRALDIDFLGNVLVTNNGWLGGSGLITGNLNVINATFAPGQSPGAVNITGDLILGQGSILQIEYGGVEPGQYDTIAVGGTTVLGGDLELLSYEGYTPPSKLDVAFLSSAAVSGKFATVSGSLAGFVPVPGDDVLPEQLPLPLQEVLDSPVAFVQIEVVDTDQSLQTLLEQAVEGEVVGATEQIRAAATQLAEKRETRLQTFSQAIAELRLNPAAADVAECADGQGGGSGACLVTRKQKDLDRLIADAPADTRKRIALLIGNEAYRGDIPALATPISDVEAIAAKLKDKHGFEVIVLRNAGKADIIREMNRLATGTVVADSVMIMYAGHGYQEEGAQGMGYWIPVDATATTAAGWVSNQDISKLLYAIPARQVMLVSDSCFSGSLTREQRVKAARGLKREEVLKQRSVLVLSSGGEEPVTDDGHDGHSIFAWNLLKVLDSAEQGLTGFELYRQVHEGVIKEFPQQPQFGASIFAGHKGDGDYFLDRLN